MFYAYIPLSMQIEKTRHPEIKHEVLSVTASPLFYGKDTRSMGGDSNVTLSVYSEGEIKTNIHFNASSLAGFNLESQDQLDGIYLIRMWCDLPRLDIQSTTNLNVTQGYGEASISFFINKENYRDCSIILDSPGKNVIMAHWQYLTLLL